MSIELELTNIFKQLKYLKENIIKLVPSINNYSINIILRSSIRVAAVVVVNQSQKTCWRNFLP